MTNIAGVKYGRLTATSLVQKGCKANSAQWQCICDCGKVVVVGSYNLRSGHTKSCGCLQKEVVRDVSRQRMTTHGHAARGAITPTWRSWISMIERCTRPNFKDFANYGGRGISVCQAWFDFATFLADMGERPAGTTIDRKDVEGNYEPGNCRWATKKEQNNNRRDNVRVCIGGVEKTLTEWAESAGLKPQTVIARHRNGWSADRLLTSPLPSRWNRIRSAHPDVKELV